MTTNHMLISKALNQGKRGRAAARVVSLTRTTIATTAGRRATLLEIVGPKRNQ